MPKVLRQVLEIFFEKVLREVREIFLERLPSREERYVKTKIVIGAFDVLNGLRYTLLALTVYIMFTVLFVMSLFSTIMLASFQYAELETITWNAPLIVTSSLFLLCACVFVFFTRQSFWIKAAGLDKKVLELTDLPSTAAVEKLEIAFKNRQSKKASPVKQKTHLSHKENINQQGSRNEGEDSVIH